MNWSVFTDVGTFMSNVTTKATPFIVTERPGIESITRWFQSEKGYSD